MPLGVEITRSLWPAEITGNSAAHLAAVGVEGELVQQHVGRKTARYLQLRAKFGWSLSNLAALLRQQLFVHRDAWKWLDEPFEPPPGLPETAMKQLALPLAARG